MSWITRLLPPIALAWSLCWIAPINVVGGASAEVPGEKSIGIEISDIAEALHEQRRCRRGLSTKSRCKETSPKKAGWYRESVITWLSDQGGKERLKVEIVSASSDLEVKLPWMQEAAFNGKHSSSWCSQLQGSGQFGSQVHSFLLDLRPPRQFFTIGECLGLPTEVDEYLSSYSDHIEVVSKNQEIIEVIGRDCHSDEDKVRFRLDTSKGFQMVYLEQFDSRGVFTIYEIHELTKFKSKHGEFWFPVHATWHGFDPTSREIDYRMDYWLDQLLVDQEFDEETFVISYPPGALMLNLDTGEGFYTTQETKANDVPDFTGKKISVRQHFEREQQNAMVANPEPKHRYFLLVTLLMLITAIYLLLRKVRHAT